MLVNENRASLREHQEACLVILKEFDRVCKLLNIRYFLFAGTLLGSIRHKGFIPWDDDLDVLMLRSDYEKFLSNAETLIDKEVFYLQKEFSCHWPMFFSKLRLNNTTCLEKYHAKDPEEHHGIYIDIFPCDNAANSSFGRRLQFVSSKIIIAKSLYKRGYETKSIIKKAFMLLCRFIPQKPFLKIVKGLSSNSEYLHTFFAAASDFNKNVIKKSVFEDSIGADFEDSRFLIPKGYHELLTKMYGDYMLIPDENERAKKQHAVFVDTKNSYTKYRDLHINLKFDNYTKSIR